VHSAVFCMESHRFQQPEEKNSRFRK